MNSTSQNHNNFAEKLKKPSNSVNVFLISFCIIFLMFVSLLTFDIYYPSLPGIARDFSVSSAKIQLSISAYFFSLAFSQLLFGPLSNHYGRKIMLLAGTIISIIGSLICFFSGSAFFFILGRLVQGIGVGSYYTLTRSIMRDLFEGQKLASFNSFISAVISIGPCLAPIIGSYFHTLFGWRFNFLFLLALFLLSAFIIQFILPETTIKNHEPRNHIKDYIFLLSNKMFRNYLICSTLSYSGLITYLTLTPFLFENELNYTPIEFSQVSFLVMLGLTFGAFLNSRLILIYKINTMIFSGGFTMLFSGLLMFFLNHFFKNNLYSIVIPSILFVISCNIIFANSASGALSPFKNLIGTSSALFGCIQIIGPSIISALISVLPFNFYIILALSFFLIGLTVVLVIFGIPLKNQVVA